MTSYNNYFVDGLNRGIWAGVGAGLTAALFCLEEIHPVGAALLVGGSFACSFAVNATIQQYALEIFKYINDFNRRHLGIAAGALTFVAIPYLAGLSIGSGLVLYFYGGLASFMPEFLSETKIVRQNA